ncbi:MAG TPA: DNA polymerase IV [Kineosporiaceae bacterium]
MRNRPVILHLDLDAFFSAVEQLHKPSLRGKPVIVGGTGGRGVVATASYEARAFGIGSAMPMAQARRLCPNAAYLAPRFAAYRAVSDVVMGVLRELSPLLEQVSIDEAYLDLEPCCPAATVEAVTTIAERTRRRVRESTGLTASIGVGSSKLIAKIGSDLAKPDGLTVIPPGEEAAALALLPVGRLPWVGPATREALRRRNVSTIGDLAALELDEVVALLGRAHGTTLHQYALGIDPRPVVTAREAKSLSAEETFPVDLTDPRELDLHLQRMAERVVARLAAKGLHARTVTVKARRYDFATLTRSTTLDRPTASVCTLLGAARPLLAAIDSSDGLRLLGFGISGLTDCAQLDLLDALAPQPDRAGPPTQPLTESLTHSPAEPAAEPAEPADDPGTRSRAGPPVWVPGADVRHPRYGAGWVQGGGLGRVTVRFEGPHTEPGRVITLTAADPELTPAPPPAW